MKKKGIRVPSTHADEGSRGGEEEGKKRRRAPFPPFTQNSFITYFNGGPRKKEKKFLGGRKASLEICPFYSCPERLIRKKGGDR